MLWYVWSFSPQLIVCWGVNWDFCTGCCGRLAEEAGLEYLEIQNLTEFYEDYRYVVFSL
jgi:hypothetical protein